MILRKQFDIGHFTFYEIKKTKQDWNGTGGFSAEKVPGEQPEKNSTEVFHIKEQRL